MKVLSPVSETQAQGNVKRLYEEIKAEYSLTHVPLLFQYLAVDETYLSYMWKKIRANTQSPVFQNQKERLISFTKRAVTKIYQPSESVVHLVERFPSSEVIKLRESVAMLTSLNATLLLVSFSIRESIKGIPFEQLSLSAEKQREYTEYSGELHGDGTKKSELSKDSEMGVMVFGTGVPDVLPFPTFFSAVSLEMARFSEKESYLTTRVGIEQVSQLSITLFPTPMRTSLRELSEMIPDTELLYELLLVLKHTFPPQFPHLLITSAVMESLLEEKTSVEVN